MADDFFARIAREMEAGTMDVGLWTRAFAESDGNENKAKALYIKLRHAQLLAAEPPPSPAGPTIAPRQPPSDLELLRKELRQKLATTSKLSFYGNLSLYADCSDAEIAAIVDRLRQQEAAGEKLAPELKYAIEALGTPTAREHYDRRLLGILSQPTPARPTSTQSTALEMDNSTAGWSAQKTTAIIAIVSVILFGYLGLNYYQERTKKEVLTGVVDNQRSAVRYAGENDTTRAQTERIQVEGRIENESKSIDHAAQLGNRVVDVAADAEARRRQQMEYEASHRVAQDEMRMRMIDEQSRQARLRQAELEQQRAVAESIRRQGEQNRKLIVP